RRKDAELDQVGCATHDGEHTLVFLGRQPVLGHDLGRDDGLGHDRASTSPSNSPRPSQPPNIASTAFSGWGIRPITVLASLKTPAMSPIEPLGLPLPLTVPSDAQ